MYQRSCNISETTLSGCYRDATAVPFSTAGQRVDPSRNSTFWHSSGEWLPLIHPMIRCLW